MGIGVLDCRLFDCGAVGCLTNAADLVHILTESAQNFGYAPGLCEASAWSKRWRGIKYFGDLTKAGFGKMGLKWLKELERALASGVTTSIHLYIRGDERTDQPRPDSSLVIDRV